MPLMRSLWLVGLRVIEPVPEHVKVPAEAITVNDLFAYDWMVLSSVDLPAPTGPIVAIVPVQAARSSRILDTCK